MNNTNTSTTDSLSDNQGFQSQFLAQLPLGILQVTQGALSYYNQIAQEIFPRLNQCSPEEAGQFLEQEMPQSTGTLLAKFRAYQYQREEQGEVLQYTLLPQQSTCNEAQMDSSMDLLSRELQSIEYCKSALAQELLFSEETLSPELKDKLSPQLARLNQSHYRLARLLDNYHVLRKFHPAIQRYCFDLHGFLKELITGTNSLFQDKSVELQASTEENFLVSSHEEYLMKVILALLCNGFRYSDSVTVRLEKKDKYALLELHDHSLLQVTRPVSQILQGVPEGTGLSPQDGSGLSLPGCKQLLGELGCTLMTETPQSGGLKYLIFVPLAKKTEQQKEVKSDIYQVSWEEMYLRELSPVLPRWVFRSEDIDRSYQQD